MSSGNSTSIPVDLGDILVKLRFLAKIQRGNKINVNSMDFVDANSIVGSISRTFRHENRNITYIFINTVIDQAVDALNKYGPRGYLTNPIFQEKLVRGLYSARRGIDELSSTYRSDPETVAKIEVCIEKIDLQLSKFRHLLDISGESNLDTDNSEVVDDPVIEVEEPVPMSE